MKVAKFILLVLAIIILFPLYLWFRYSLWSLSLIPADVRRDNQEASKIREIYEDKTNWKLYTNSKLGFSLLLPPSSKPYDAYLKGSSEFQGDIEFDDNREVIIPTEEGGTETIVVGVVDNFQRVKYVPGEQGKTYIYTQEYIRDFPLYAEQKGITLEKLAGTDLIKIGDYQYHHFGDKNLSFTISGGDLTNWFFRDTIYILSAFAPKHSKAADEIKNLQLEILRTVKFFPPEK